MAKTNIPPDVRRFVLTSIPSVPHIEALILMHSSAPQRWSAAELAKRLYVPLGIAHAVLDELHRSGILQSDTDGASYFFDHLANSLGQVIDNLTELYRTHLVEITLLIHSRLDRKAQQFADAFTLRKDSNG